MIQNKIEKQEINVSRAISWCATVYLFALSAIWFKNMNLLIVNRLPEQYIQIPNEINNRFDVYQKIREE